MGYTHYYYQTKSIPQKKWEQIAIDAMKVVEFCEDSGIELRYECDINKAPEISDTMIRFNGHGNQGHETFVLFKKKPKQEAWQRNSPPNDNKYFYFCKTAHKPYDVAVGLVLLIVNKHAKEVLEIISDGDWECEWDVIRQSYNKIFGEDPVCPFKTEKV